MRNLKLMIEYDGHRYLGWQRLGDSDKTIQGKIERVLTQITGEKIEIIGSGRTDAGTHAKGQVANFKTQYLGSPTELIESLNQQLPKDIVITKVEEVSERFHARYNVKGKKYTYYVWNASIPSAFERQYSYHYPQLLDNELMNEACQQLLGEHDFIGFSALKKTKKSTVRKLEELSITREGAILCFTFVGDGFLHKMVRILMGTLLEIGSGQRSINTINAIFQQQVRSEAGMTVPAQGLFLEEVYY